MARYYLPQFNWSVFKHEGQWCLGCRFSSDIEATMPEQIAAVLDWARLNREKFKAGTN